MLAPIREEKYFEGGSIKEEDGEEMSDHKNKNAKEDQGSESDESNKDVWIRVSLDLEKQEKERLAQKKQKIIEAEQYIEKRKLMRRPIEICINDSHKNPVRIKENLKNQVKSCLDSLEYNRVFS